MSAVFAALAFVAVTLAAVASTALLYPKHYLPITDQVRRSCSESSECFVSQSKNASRYRILFKEEKAKGAVYIQEVVIKSETGGGDETYKLPTEKAIFKNEAVPLFVVDVNKDGYNDLALHSGDSASRGMVYYYWIYNPKSKKFVFSTEMAPALQGFDNKRISALTAKENYVINNDYQLVEKR